MLYDEQMDTQRDEVTCLKPHSKEEELLWGQRALLTSPMPSLKVSGQPCWLENSNSSFTHTMRKLRKTCQAFAPNGYSYRRMKRRTGWEANEGKWNRHITYLSIVNCGEHNYVETQQANLKLILVICVLTLSQFICTWNPGREETKEAIYLRGLGNL